MLRPSLHPLLYLSAVIILSGSEQTFSVPSKFDISSCPITFYGRKQDNIFVNFTSQNLVICFRGFFSPGAKDDCVFGPRPDSNQASFSIYPRIPILETIVESSLPSVQNRMDCFFSFSFQYYKSHTTLALIKFGSLSVMYVYASAASSVVVGVQVDGEAVDSLSITNTPNTPQNQGFLDLSGCRSSGVAYKPGAQVITPETCISVTCNETVLLQTPTCGPLERCLGNGSCVLNAVSNTESNPSLDSICTVTGPSIIDVHGYVNSVTDRCAYSLLSIPSVPELQVLANFQERRRKDVSFLDSVTLRLDESGVQIHLKQGGRVLLDSSALVLNSSSQVVHSVELSKDQTGVTAKVPRSNFTISVFFDGNTAQIHLEGPAGSSLQGLCGNANRSVSDLKLSESSSTSCEMQHTDTNDNSINCTRMTERCNLLKETPFSSCDIDPEPYMTACSETLCRYPAVDGLRCHFLEAYSRACSLRSNTTLGGWRSKTECSRPDTFCLDQTCSNHEFCGEKSPGGETRCFCRAIFASKYRENHVLGDPAVCSQNSASLSLVGCLLEDKGIDYSALHLTDPTCRGQMDQQTHMLTFSFSSSSRCGAEVTSNSQQVVYQNIITNQNSSSDIISHSNQVHVAFSCMYHQADIKTFQILSSSVIRMVSSGVWNYTLTMAAFSDRALSRVVESGSEMKLNQKIWVELKTDGLDGNLVSVVMDSCWATNHESENGSLRYDLILNGCPNSADPTVEVEQNGDGTSSLFSFNMFQFSGSSGEVYLHCRVQLCVRGGGCSPKCGGARRRRSIRSRHGGPTFISLVWTD